MSAALAWLIAIAFWKIAIVAIFWSYTEPWTRKFLLRTLQHKWWVLVAGLRTGAPLWRLVAHDWSKFLPSEARAYGRHYYGPRDRKEEFKLSWHHHQRRNPHHWEYWVPVDSGAPLAMPEPLAREMVADWMAATRAVSGRWPEVGDWPWFEQNRHRLQLHPTTWLRVYRVMADALPLSKKLLREQVTP